MNMKEFLKDMERKFEQEITSTKEGDAVISQHVLDRVRLAFSRSANYALVRDLKRDFPEAPTR